MFGWEDGAIFSVIIAANNEEAWIGRCLEALLTQTPSAGSLQIIVSANACRDRTEGIVNELAAEAEAQGHVLHCISSPEPGKVAALNRAEALVAGDCRAYLDADVICDPELFGQLRTVLDRAEPAYATGTLAVAPARTWVTRRYADLWARLPFVRGGAVGAGLFAVNDAGRARWEAFPPIISDDTFVRLQFTPEERHEVPACYHWPMVEGWTNLVRVRRRQDAGVREIYRLYPHLRANEGKSAVTRADLLRLAATAPLSFGVYAGVALNVRMLPAAQDWSRGR